MYDVGFHTLVKASVGCELLVSKWLLLVVVEVMVVSLLPTSR